MNNLTKDPGKTLPPEKRLDFSKIPGKIRDGLIPEKGQVVAVPQKIQGQDQVGIYKVTARNPGKLRFTATLQGFMAPPAKPAEHPKGAGGRTTLDVHSGAMGGGSTFKSGKDTK